MVNTHTLHTQIDEQSTPKRAYLKLARGQSRKGLKKYGALHDLSKTPYVMCEEDPRHQEMVRLEHQAKLDELQRAADEEAADGKAVAEAQEAAHEDEEMVMGDDN
jgi:hypothetical protein